MKRTMAVVNGTMKTENSVRPNDYISIKFTRFFMRFYGMWRVTNARDKIVTGVTTATITITMIISVMVVTADTYYSWGDFYEVSYCVPPLMSVLLEFSKLMILMMHRREVIELNDYTEDTFWKIEYSSEDLQILESCDKKTRKACFIFMFVLGAVSSFFVVDPFFEMKERNFTDRVLPFRLHVNFPVMETPYYELMYALQISLTYSVALCAGTFCNYLFILNLFTASQFCILQRRLQESCRKFGDCQESGKTSLFEFNESYRNIVACIKMHQLLISYIERIEKLFCHINLAQTMIAVLIMCFTCFQVLLGYNVSIRKTIHSTEYFIAGTIQLFLFNWSSHEIIIESAAVSQAAYQASWYCLPCYGSGKAFRNALVITVNRAQKPCTLTVGKFCPMSLDTFSSAFSTTISYFTVLRQLYETR